MSDQENKHSLVKINILPEKTTDALLTPAATSLGKAFKDIVEAISNKTLGPIKRYNLVKEQELKDFEDKLNTNINNIPEENRDQSKMGITFKALEDSKYQLNEEVMREAFANLISNSLDSTKNKTISPKYSDILSNMSSNEANLFSIIYKNNQGRLPLITIDVKTKESATRRIRDYIMILNDKTTKQYEQLTLSLLEGSNLIEIQEYNRWTAPIFVELYDYAENELVDFDSFKNEIEEDDKVKMNRHLLKLTSLGEELAAILFC